MPTNNSCDYLSPIAVASGGTGAATFTADGVLYGNTTSAIGVTAVGTAGQVLTSNGAGNAPTFTDRGIWVKLQTQNASTSATLSFTSLISSTYATYVVVFDRVMTATGSTLKMLVSDNNGSTWANTNYFSGIQYTDYNSGAVGHTNSTTYLNILTGCENIYGTSGTLWLYNFGASSIPTIQGDFVLKNSTSTFWEKSFGVQIVTSTWNAIQFLFDVGPIRVGTFTLYGVLQ